MKKKIILKRVFHRDKWLILILNYLRDRGKAGRFQRFFQRKKCNGYLILQGTRSISCYYG